jgi:Holliday junction resolvasome RuvABC ATP-dependent DNA helicase subunit
MATHKKLTPITSLLTLAYHKIEKTHSSKKKRTLEEVLTTPSVVECFAKIEHWFKEMKSSLELNPERILTLVLFFSNEECDATPKFETIGEYIGLSSNLEILKLTEAVNYFQKEGIIRNYRHIRGNTKKANTLLSNFHFESNFLTALVMNKLYAYNFEKEKVTEMQLIRKSVLIFEKMDMESSYDTKEGFLNFISLIKCNRHLDLVKKLEELYNLAEFGQENEEFKLTPAVNQFVTIYLISRSFKDEGPLDVIAKFEDVIGIHLTLELVNQLENGEHALIRNDFVRIAPTMLREQMSLNIEDTPKLVNHFLPNTSSKMEFERLKFIRHIETTKPENKFYYPEELKEELNFVEELFQHNHEKLTVYISGKPGTGKTSFVNKIAFETNRMLFTSKQIKSMWFGESQQNLEKMFDEMEKLLKKLEKQPIFFIDEADGLLGSRMNSSDGINSTMNELQTILLRRIESYKGILICCSNFPITTLDAAFERRFDLIIDMKSNFESRYQMLKQRAKKAEFTISNEEIKRLATYENLQPAVIDLIFRKAKLNMLVNKGFDLIKEAEARIIEQTGIKKIAGFGLN